MCHDEPYLPFTDVNIPNNASATNLTVQSKPSVVSLRYSSIDGDIKSMYLALTPARKAQLKIKLDSKCPENTEHLLRCGTKYNSSEPAEQE